MQRKDKSEIFTSFGCCTLYIPVSGPKKSALGMPFRLGGPWIGCFAHGNIRYERFDHLKLGDLTYTGDNWRQWFLERITFAPLSWYAWITLACLSCIRRAAMMRDLFSLFDLFNSYTTIFSIVLHLVFFVVIAPVIPKLKKKDWPFWWEFLHGAPQVIRCCIIFYQFVSSVFAVYIIVHCKQRSLVSLSE